jgi:hypothetical protein
LALVHRFGLRSGSPHHATFSKNRHGRFLESDLFQQLFEEIVARCLETGLVRGDHLSVDGSFVEANAAKESRVPREQLEEVAQVNRTVRQYLVEQEEQNPVEDQYTSKSGYRPPFRIRLMPPRVAHRRGLGTTITISSTITAV